MWRRARRWPTLGRPSGATAGPSSRTPAAGSWPTAPGTSPTGLALDAANGRLYVGCRNQKLVVMATKDGSVLADLPIGRGVDAAAFRDGTAFASCGDGTLAVVRETAAGKFEVAQ